jgi:HD-GYP domain-containing protein (c-di-GMP phosphodiesterase class II)
MVQDRPYRRGLSVDAVLAFMNDLVRQNRVEGEIVAVLEGDMPGAMAAALHYIHPES